MRLRLRRLQTRSSRIRRETKKSHNNNSILLKWQPVAKCIYVMNYTWQKLPGSPLPTHRDLRKVWRVGSSRLEGKHVMLLILNSCHFHLKFFFLSICEFQANFWTRLTSVWLLFYLILGFFLHFSVSINNANVLLEKICIKASWNPGGCDSTGTETVSRGMLDCFLFIRFTLVF